LTLAFYVGIVFIIAAYIWLIVDLFLIPGYVRAYDASFGRGPRSK